MKKTKKPPDMTRRERLVRETSRRLGKNLSTAANEMGMTPGGLYSVLRSKRPQNETLARVARWLTEHGVSVDIENLGASSG